MGYYALSDHEIIRDCPTGRIWLGIVLIFDGHRGKRYSPILLEHACRQAKASGFSELYLVTEHVNYYERFGFMHIGHAPMSLGGNGFAVCDQHNRLAGFIQLAKEIHNVLAGFGIKVAGRLISQNQRGLCGKCAGDGNTLLLAAGKLCRFVVGTGFQPNLTNCIVDPSLAFFCTTPLIDQRKFYVFLCSHS